MKIITIKEQEIFYPYMAICNQFEIVYFGCDLWEVNIEGHNSASLSTPNNKTI